MLGEVTKLLSGPLALAAMVNSPAAFMQMPVNTLLALLGSRLTSSLNAHFILGDIFFFLACMCFSASLPPLSSLSALLGDLPAPGSLGRSERVGRLASTLSGSGVKALI